LFPQNTSYLCFPGKEQYIIIERFYPFFNKKGQLCPKLYPMLPLLNTFRTLNWTKIKEDIISLSVQNIINISQLRSNT
jgi:hypothetical protein